MVSDSICTNQKEPGHALRMPSHRSDYSETLSVGNSIFYCNDPPEVPLFDNYDDLVTFHAGGFSKTLNRVSYRKGKQDNLRPRSTSLGCRLRCSRSMCEYYRYKKRLSFATVNRGWSEACLCPSKSNVERAELDWARSLTTEPDEKQLANVITSVIFCSSERDSVFMEQVRWFLKRLFQVKGQILEKLEEEAIEKLNSESSVTITIVEARNLPSKNTSGTCDSYVRVRLSEQQRVAETSVQNGTVNPKWHYKITLRTKDLHKKTMSFDVLHEKKKADNVITSKVFSKRKSPNEENEATFGLLGTAQLQIKDIAPEGMDEWLSLMKDSKHKNKSRGLLHLRGKRNLDIGTEQEKRKVYTDLLARIFQHHYQTSFEGMEKKGSCSWNGEVDSVPSKILAQLSACLCLLDHHQILATWLVASRVADADPSWLLENLTSVLDALDEGKYTEDELQDLQKSFQLFVKMTLQRFLDLNHSFSPSSHVQDSKRLNSTVRMLKLLEMNPQGQRMLEVNYLGDISSYVKYGLADYINNWWKNLLETRACLRDARQGEEEVSCLVEMAEEICTFLERSKVFHGPPLLEVLEIPYFQNAFSWLSAKYISCCKPVLDRAYVPATRSEVMDVGSLGFNMVNECNIFKLYFIIRKILGLGDTLSPSILENSSFSDYHKWFYPGIQQWLDMAIHRANEYIKKAVERDDVVPTDRHNHCSSSAVDANCILHAIIHWWRELEWPSGNEYMPLLMKVVDGLCTSSILYTDFLLDRIVLACSKVSSNDCQLICRKLSCGLNNIDNVLANLCKFCSHIESPDLLLHLENGRNSPTQGNGDCSTTTSHHINKTSLILESKKTDLIKTFLEQNSDMIKEVIINGRTGSSPEETFLKDLQPLLEEMMVNLDTDNFKLFLWNLWKSVLACFQELVDKEGRTQVGRSKTYFKGLETSLRSAYSFFTLNNKFLDSKTAANKDYSDLIRKLHYLQLDLKSLLTSYYEERLEEQNVSTVAYNTTGKECSYLASGYENPSMDAKQLRGNSSGQLVVQAYFDGVQRLAVQVLMAKLSVDVAHTVFGNKSSLWGCLSPNPSRCLYIKTELVTEAGDTKVMRTPQGLVNDDMDAVSFQKSFEFDLDATAAEGFLLFNLKLRHNFSSLLIGEALVRLRDLEHYDADSANTEASPIHLRMTCPRPSEDYESLKILSTRQLDKATKAFIRQRSASAIINNE